MTKKKFIPARGYSRSDWDAVEGVVLTQAQAGKGKSLKDVLPKLHAAIKRSPGRPKLPDATVPVTIRIKPETLERFQATGKGWRVRMAEALEQPARPRKRKAA